MYESVPKRINAVIRVKGYKQYAIAERAGFKAKEFNDLLNGRKTFKAEYVNPICEALGVTPNILFGFEDLPSPPA